MFEDVQAVIGPYCEPPVACRDFDPSAAEIARQVGGLISQHLTGFRVEHVGSTAVPSGAGRGIVDLLVSGPEAEIDTAGRLLSRLGFQCGAQCLFPPHPPPYCGTYILNDESFLLNAHVLPAGAGEIDSMRFLLLLSAPMPN